jgi:hypothetical protein
MPFTYKNSVELKKVLLLMRENKTKLHMSREEIGTYAIDKSQVEILLRNIDEKSCMTEKNKNYTKIQMH